MTQNLQRAVEILRAGGLVAFPTETVYGLGADAGNPDAVRKIFAAKGRPAEHPLIVHLPSMKELEEWAADIPNSAYQLAELFWPGPLTLILKRAGRVPEVVTGGQDTVGLRVPGHRLALELLRAFGGGIAAPSANRFGRISPTTAQHVRTELGDRVDLILDGGPCEVGLESTIVDLSRGKPQVLRPGGISLEALAEVLGDLPQQAQKGGGQTPRASGTLKSHYAPTTPTVLVASAELPDFLASQQGRGVAVLAWQAKPPAAPELAWKTLPADPRRYGQGLYAGLRELDGLGCELIVIEAVPETPEWLAVRDRLQRATTGLGTGPSEARPDSD